MYNREDLPIGV